MADDNIPSQEIPLHRYTAVFRDVISRIQLLQKSNRTNHLQCCHRFSLTLYVNDIRLYVNTLPVDVVVMLEFLMYADDLH